MKYKKKYSLYGGMYKMINVNDLSKLNLLDINELAIYNLAIYGLLCPHYKSIKLSYSAIPNFKLVYDIITTNNENLYSKIKDLKITLDQNMELIAFNYWFLCKLCTKNLISIILNNGDCMCIDCYLSNYRSLDFYLTFHTLAHIYLYILQNYNREEIIEEIKYFHDNGIYDIEDSLNEKLKISLFKYLSNENHNFINIKYINNIELKLDDIINLKYQLDTIILSIERYCETLTFNDSYINPDYYESKQKIHDTDYKKIGDYISTENRRVKL